MPMPKKEENTNNNNATASSGLSGKTITALHAWESGAVAIFEVVTASGSTFLKVRQSQMEVGGTADWGSGTRVI